MKTRFWWAAMSLWATGCGGNLSQSTARDQATTKSCDWYAKCGQIGAGKQYPDRDQCEVSVRAFWNAAWPIAACDNKIRSSDFDVCTAGIDATACGNGLDFLNTLVNKCGQAQVCRG